MQERGEPMQIAHRVSEPRPLRFLLILFLAFALRAFAAISMFRNDPRLWFYDQASELTCLAHSVLTGQGLSSPFGGSTGPSAFLAPGYPLLVALIYRILGASTAGAAAALIALNVLFGILTVVTAMLVARRLFDNRTAYITGILCAIAPTMIWLPTLFWETSLSMLLLTGTILFALRCIDRPTPAHWIAYGAYCALGMFINPALLVTFAGVGSVAACKARSQSRLYPWLATAACAALFMIWPVRNAIALRAFIPLRSNLGYELWQGNRPGSQGLFTPGLYLNANHEEYERYASLGELTYMHEKSSIAVEAIMADPVRFVRLSLKRVVIFWTALGGHGMSKVVIGEIALTSLCGTVSFVLFIYRRTPLTPLLLIPFLLFPIPYYLTHPDFRFRLLLQPLALMLTGWLLQKRHVYLKPPTPYLLSSADRFSTPK